MQRRQAATRRAPEPELASKPRAIDLTDVPNVVSEEHASIIVVVTDPNGTERTEVFHQTEVMLGRTIDNDLYLPGDRVSRCHAMLTLDGNGKCLVVDMGSTNGTLVNGHDIATEPTALDQDDYLQVGGFALRVYGLGGDDENQQSSSRERRPSPKLDGRTDVMTRDMLDEATATPSPPNAEVRTAPAPSSGHVPSSGRSRPARGSVYPRDRSSIAPGKQAAPPSSRSRSGNVGPSSRRNTVMEPLGKLTGPAEETLSPDLVAALVRRVVNGLHPDMTDEQRQALFGEHLVHLTSRANLAPQVIHGLTETAHEEIFGLGALKPFLERADVERIRVHRRKVVVHDGQAWREEGQTYSCREAVERSVARLRRGGEHLDDWEVSYVSLSEEEGGALIDLRRRPPLHALSAWAQHAAASPSMVRMLEQAMIERLNILVVGQAPELLGALALTTPAPEGLWIGAPPGSDFDGTVLRPKGEALAQTLMSTATRAFDHVFFPDAPSALDPLLEAVVRGLQGVVTMWPAQSTEVAVHRATSHLAAVRKCDVELAWSQISSCFDLAVEVGPGRGLRPIERIARFEGDGSLVDLQRHEDGRFESIHPGMA